MRQSLTFASSYAGKEACGIGLACLMFMPPPEIEVEAGSETDTGGDDTDAHSAQPARGG